MMEPLPVKGLQMTTNISEEDIKSTPDDNTGYNIECDLEIPEDLHETLKEFPPAPETLCPSKDMLSEFQHGMMTQNNMKPSSCPKLIPHLMKKEKYVIHYRHSKYILKLGVKLTKIHRVPQFQQTAWLKPYIDMNTKFRKDAKNEFEKDFFKLMNNSVFGNTMERNRMQLHLTTNNDNAIKWFSKVNLKTVNTTTGFI